MAEYDFVVHPDAELFPMLPDDELQALADDIRENGLINPIILTEGELDGKLVEFLVDGRNRLRACELAGVDPRFELVNGNADSLAVSLNTKRRNLDKQQLAVIAAKAWKRAEEEGRTTNKAGRKSAQNGQITEPHKHFATLYGVSKNYVQDAKFVLDNLPGPIESALLPRGHDRRRPLLDLVADAKQEVERRRTDEEAARQAAVKRLEEEAEWARLTETASDLAQLVAEERMSAAEALTLYRQRVAEAQRQREEKITLGREALKVLVFVSGHVQSVASGISLGDETVFEDYYVEAIRNGLDALKWLADEVGAGSDGEES